MGNKKGGSSWLTAVKRAFRSPSKEDSPKKAPRLREDPDAEEDKVRPFLQPLHLYSHSLSSFDCLSILINDVYCVVRFRPAEQEGEEEMAVPEVLIPIAFAGGARAAGAAAAAIGAGEVRACSFGDR
jgi:hypothetical protein